MVSRSGKKVARPTGGGRRAGFPGGQPGRKVLHLGGTGKGSYDANMFHPAGDAKKGLGNGTARNIDVRQIRQKLGVSQEELARVTGYSTRSVAGWEGGQVLSEPARQKLIETERLRVSLAQVIPEDHLGAWLREPNPAFEGQAPIQVIERGESDRLWRMIFQIDANVAS